MVRLASAGGAVGLALAVSLSASAPTFKSMDTFKRMDEPEGVHAGGRARAKLMPGAHAPIVVRASAASRRASRLRGEGSLTYTAQGPSTIALARVPRTATAASLAEANQRFVRGSKRIESRFNSQDVARAQAWARTAKPGRGLQELPSIGEDDGHGFFHKLKRRGPQLKKSWDAIDAGDCCENTGFAATVPPDPDIAVGKHHVIAVVNTSFEVYDKRGNSLTGPIQFSTFFDPTQGGTDPDAEGEPTPGCTAYADFFGDGNQFGAVFDPDVVYDEEHDRFVIGIDGNATDYCVAATVTGDPTGEWNRYGFETDVNGAFFDFPHIGVGLDAIYMGSNNFLPAPPFFEGRVYAMDKAAMYVGDPLTVVTRDVKPDDGLPNLRLDGTPQPAQLHGYKQRTYPKHGPHYIMTEYFDGKVHSVYAWMDPFGQDDFDLVGDVDLAAASGVPCESFSCFPVSWPQADSDQILQGNDYRGQETKYRNGQLWTAQTISCNPGDGTVNCIRWAEINPKRVVPGELDLTTFVLTARTRGVGQAGVFASDGDHRTFPSLAVNHCDDMAIGYTVGGASIYPSIYVTGRKDDDKRGRVRREVLLKEGDVPYTSFQDNQPEDPDTTPGVRDPQRWGDYTGMTIDPDGKTFWYLGEYSRDNSVANPFAGWGTYVGKFEFECRTHRKKHKGRDDDDDHDHDDRRRRGD